LITDIAVLINLLFTVFFYAVSTFVRAYTLNENIVPLN